MGWGQQNVGYITGAVRDPAGAVVPGAAIVAMNEATRVETALQTTGAGIYTVPALQVGTYTVTVIVSGFKTTQQTGIRVVAGLGTSADFTLEVGAVAEKVEVSAQATPVDTTSATEGTTRTLGELADLPVSLGSTIRNPFDYVATFTGTITAQGYGAVVPMGAGAGGPWDAFATYKIDGAEASVSMASGWRDSSPPVPESIEEVRMVRDENADTGVNLGAGLEIILKSGTNQFHGSAFEYFQNGSALNARNWFVAKVTPDKRNEFGGVIGGPILKNKLFFFATYDGSRRRVEPAGTLQTVPTAKMRTGDFSEWEGTQTGTDTLGRPIYQGEIYDPSTTRSDGNGGFVRDPLPNNTIPSSSLSPISLKLQSYYPLPNLPGTTLNWIGTQIATRNSLNRASWKFDYTQGPHHLSVAHDHLFDLDNTQGGLFEKELSTSFPSTYFWQKTRITYTWAMRPSLLFSFRTAANYGGFSLGSGVSPEARTFGASVLGLKGLTFPDTPNISIQGYPGPGSHGTDLNNGPTMTFPFDTDVSWTRGKHSFKFGETYIVAPSILRFNTLNSFSFTQQLTGLPGNVNTGNGWASMLLGNVNSATATGGQAYRNIAIQFGLFAQDQWRVTRKLTVNYGLRWDLGIPPFESHDRIASFDPTVPNAAAGGLLGALTFWGTGPGRDGRHNELNTYYRAFGPRLGLAYALNQKTVIRAYYGIIYSPISADANEGQSLSTYGLVNGQASITSLDNGIHSPFNWNNGVPLVVPAPPFLDPTQLNGQGGVEWINPTQNRPAMVQDLGFGIEREFAGINFRAEYAGKLTHRISNHNQNQTEFQVDQLPLQYLSLGNLLNQSVIAAAAMAAGIKPPYPGFTGPVWEALITYPQYLGVQSLTLRDNFSLFHAAQFNAQKRFGNGLTFLLAYTISKDLIGIPVQNDVAQRSLRKGLISWDQPQNFSISYVYDLPFGPGKRFLNTPNPVLKQVVGLWQVSGINTYVSGWPITVSESSSIPTMAAFPLRNPAVPISSIGCGDYNPGNANSRYLNVNAFIATAPFTLGDTSQLRQTRGCAAFNENLSLQKRFPITESKRIVLGGDFFNVLNRHQWTGLTYPTSSNINVPSSFGRFTGASNPRTIQLHFRFEF
jgi:hypothetical protein